MRPKKRARALGRICRKPYRNMFFMGGNINLLIGISLFRAICKLCTAICLSWIFAYPSFAQKFIQTGNFYQASDGSAQVIPTHSEVPGIFFYVPEKAIPLQKFAHTELTQGISAFLVFSPTLNRYTKLLVHNQGQIKELAVNGSFAFNLGNNLLISVDNDPNPYCTAILGNEGKNPTLIAFNGNTPLLNYEGAESVALFKANQTLETQDSDKKYGIEPYNITKDGIFLKGESFNRATVGLNIPPPRNDCLPNSANKQDSIIYLEEKVLRNIKKIKDPQSRKNSLSAAIKASEGKDPLSSLIILKIASDMIITFNFENSSVQVIKPMSTDPDFNICEIKRVDLR